MIKNAPSSITGIFIYPFTFAISLFEHYNSRNFSLTNPHERDQVAGWFSNLAPVSCDGCHILFLLGVPTLSASQGLSPQDQKRANTLLSKKLTYIRSGLELTPREFIAQFNQFAYTRFGQITGESELIQLECAKAQLRIEQLITLRFCCGVMLEDMTSKKGITKFIRKYSETLSINSAGGFEHISKPMFERKSPCFIGGDFYALINQSGSNTLCSCVDADKTIKLHVWMLGFSMAQIREHQLVEKTKAILHIKI